MVTQVNLYPVSGRVVWFGDVEPRREEFVARYRMAELIRSFRTDRDFELTAKYRNQLKIYTRKSMEV